MAECAKCAALTRDLKAAWDRVLSLDAAKLAYTELLKSLAAALHCTPDAATILETAGRLWDFRAEVASRVFCIEEEPDYVVLDLVSAGARG